MDKIIIVSGTNREDALTRIVADIYAEILNNLGAETEIIDLQLLPHSFAFTALYDKAGKNTEFNQFREVMAREKKFVFIVPEYNGSFPGVLKTFIDGLKFPNSFKHKKCALVGLSSGIQGAGMALSHLTDIFNYCGMHVLAAKPKLSHIENNLEEGHITNKLYQSLLETQAQQLIEF